MLYGQLRGIENIGMYFTVYALCLLATRPLFGKMADRWGAERVLLFGVMCFAASYIVLFTVHDFARLIVSGIIGSAGFGACAPLIQSLALSSVPIERRGAASNTAFTGMDVGMLLGPVIGGTTIELLEPIAGSLVQSYATMWLVMLVPVAVACVVIVRWNIKKP